MMTLVTTITMTAVSRVSAAQPDAFWLACERGCDTLFVHDAVRQQMIEDYSVRRGDWKLREDF